MTNKRCKDWCDTFASVYPVKSYCSDECKAACRPLNPARRPVETFAPLPDDEFRRAIRDGEEAGRRAMRRQALAAAERDEEARRQQYLTAIERAEATERERDEALVSVKQAVAAERERWQKFHDEEKERWRAGLQRANEAAENRVANVISDCLRIVEAYEPRRDVPADWSYQGALSRVAEAIRDGRPAPK